MTNAENIVEVQTAYFNEPIIEIKPNQGFTDKQYQADITSVGWYVGGEWCAFSAILACKKGYVGNNHADIWVYFQKLASGNSQQMARNCHNDKFWPTGLIPKVGAIIIWQAGDSFTEGHTGLCIAVDPDGIHYTTLEGNSIPPGNPGDEREGYTIAKHIHVLGQPHSSLGLNFLRAIYAVEQLN